MIQLAGRPDSLAVCAWFHNPGFLFSGLFVLVFIHSPIVAAAFLIIMPSICSAEFCTLIKSDEPP